MSALLLLAALIVAPIIGGGFGELTNSILQVLVLTGVVLHVIAHRRQQNAWPEVPGWKPLLVFLLVFVVSTAFSKDLYLSLKQLLFVGACAAAYMLAATLARDARIGAGAVWATVLTALGISLFGIQDYAISQGGGSRFWQALFATGTHDRLFGTFINPGFFGGYLVLAIPVSIAAYLVTRRFATALLAGLAVVFEILALMLTGTKFAIIAVVLGLVLFFGLAIVTNTLKRARFRRIIALAIVLLPLIWVFRAPVLSRISAAESGGAQVHSTEFRKYTWVGTMHIIRDNPVIGIGPGAFELIYPRYQIAGPTKYAHQSYLQVAAESGLVGFAAFVAALMLAAWLVLRGAVRHDPALGQKMAEEPSQGPDMLIREALPFSGWRLVNLALIGALAGSMARNLVDSDWYVIGIALPFAVLAGVAAAQSGAVKESRSTAKSGWGFVTAICAVMILLSLSFGLGDLIAPGLGALPADAVERYRLASRLSPLNPEYRRELARCEAGRGDTSDALEQARAAIRLGPNDSANYYAMGQILLAANEPDGAIAQFQRVLDLNPNATGALLQIGVLDQDHNDRKGAQAAYRRLIEIEDSPFEKIKGAPELVDTTYAYAHFYFGSEYLAEKDYRKAVVEFTSAASRLDRWRSNEQVLAMRRAIGALDPQEEARWLQLLRDSYEQLATAYLGLNDKIRAERARKQAATVKLPE